ncbi:DNA-directed RNA polymerase II [Elysia marginata]|uniref:DNA-directed RNA polymerase II n=1 Tax=Elysia marginata TaxID=1093978 RepID=A0AAV4J9N6_9GAST|nr:DNA-directed RNA polymerase II [Elysia marginata]
MNFDLKVRHVTNSDRQRSASRSKWKRCFYKNSTNNIKHDSSRRKYDSSAPPLHTTITQQTNSDGRFRSSNIKPVNIKGMFPLLIFHRVRLSRHRQYVKSWDIIFAVHFPNIAASIKTSKDIRRLRKTHTTWSGQGKVKGSLAVYSLAVYSLAVYSLAVYSLAVYSLAIYSLAVYSLAVYSLAVYSLAVYSLAVYSLAVYSLAVYSLATYSLALYSLAVYSLPSPT